VCTYKEQKNYKLCDTVKFLIWWDDVLL